MNSCLLLAPLLLLLVCLSTEALRYKKEADAAKVSLQGSVTTAAKSSWRYDKSSKTTLIGKLACSFEPVLSQRGPIGRQQHVDTSHLLRACNTFVETMRKTGQHSVARDLEHNVQKFENLYKKAPVGRRQSLLALLEFEREGGIHGPGGILMDPSAAVGLLWIRRSISFQAKMYRGVLDEKRDATNAALDAYRTEVQPYHGWALRRLYTMSFETVTPPRKEILARMGGYKVHEFGEAEEKATVRDLEKLLTLWEPIIVHWKRTYLDLDLEDSRQV